MKIMAVFVLVLAAALFVGAASAATDGNYTLSVNPTEVTHGQDATIIVNVTKDDSAKIDNVTLFVDETNVKDNVTITEIGVDQEITISTSNLPITNNQEITAKFYNITSGIVTLTLDGTAPKLSVMAVPKPTLGDVTADLTEVDINTETNVNISAAYVINDYDTAEDYYLNITADSKDVTFDVESIQINASTTSPGKFLAAINATTNETIEITVQLMQASTELANKTVSITVNDTTTPVVPTPEPTPVEPTETKVNVTNLTEAMNNPAKIDIATEKKVTIKVGEQIVAKGTKFIFEYNNSVNLTVGDNGVLDLANAYNGKYIAYNPQFAKADTAEQTAIGIEVTGGEDYGDAPKDSEAKSVGLTAGYAGTILYGGSYYKLQMADNGAIANAVFTFTGDADYALGKTNAEGLIYIPATAYNGIYEYVSARADSVTYYFTVQRAVDLGGDTPGPSGDNRVLINLNTGMDAFVYEYINVDGSVSGNKLTKFTEGSNPGIVNQIFADSTGNFYLTEEVVGGNYGTYYLADTWAQVGTTTKYVNIWYPELSIKAELTQATGGTAGDSIDGKTVNKDTDVTFLVNAPKVGPAFQDRTAINAAYGPAKVKIVFTTPVAGKTTVFGLYSANDTQADFNDVELTASQTALESAYAGEDASAGTWTAQAEYIKYAPFADNAKKSNTISFTLQSSTLTITAAKDSVVRSNPFTVTISGKAQVPYAVYLETPATNEINPTLQDGQNGFQGDYQAATIATVYKIIDGKIFYSTYDPAIGGVFKTDASGKRTIQFNTAAETEDKTYTIKVSGLTTDDNNNITFDSSDYDKVKIKVEKGAVTIAASGDGSYYLGDEIKLTGTNTDSTLVFLFITGKNLGSADGNVLKALPTLKQAALATNPVAVKTDNTWEYKWDTSRIAIDPGAYTIFATSRLTNGKSSTVPFDVTGKESEKYGSVIEGEDGLWAVKLSDSEYATISVNLKKPFLSAVPSGTVIAKGDNLYVRGTAEGNPSSLNIYIFGDNLFEDYSVNVEDDGSYEKKIEIPDGMSSGQYFVVIQHPMMNGLFDAAVNKDNNGDEFFEIPNAKLAANSAQSSFYVTGEDRLPGSQAADALTKMIDSPNIDDIYTKLTFSVADAWIRISNPGDKAVGSKFTITGTTNLAIDDQVIVEVLSSSFEATDKTQDLGNSGVTQTTKVVAGEAGDNVWTIEVDTTNWKLDEYMIEARGIEVDATTTTNFNLVEKVVTPTPTATGATPTTTATATATATETPKTPGFGAFIALAGLGAVALLVLRRN